MATRRTLKLRELRAILTSYGVSEDTSRGKGGHTLFFAMIEGARYTYPVPGDREVKDCYVKGCRRKFKLTPEDGVSDGEFYGRA